MRPPFTCLVLVVLTIYDALVYAVPTVPKNFDMQASVAAMQDTYQVKRSVGTCADPSLARKFYQGYATTLTAHDMDTHVAFVHADTSQGPSSILLWALQGAIFMVWPTQQPFTVPLFRLSVGTGEDFIFMTGPDAQTPPAVPGFNTNAGNILAWVYNTPVCGSLPLMSAVLVAESDHYHTIDSDEHAELLERGWTDAGIVAFVLPSQSS